MSGLDDLFSEAEQVQAGLQTQPPPVMRTTPPPQPLSFWDQLLAKVPAGLVNNAGVDVARRVTTAAAAPETGAAQLAAKTAAALRVPGAADAASAINSGIDRVNAENDAAGANLPTGVRVGSDIVGSVIAPSNMLLASWLKPATSLGGAAIQGAKIGLAQGATAPVENADQSYWLPKVGRTALSTVMGAISQPALTIAGNKVAQYVAKFGADPNKAAAQADEILTSALGESGQSLSDVPPAQLAAVRGQIADALAKGQKLDAAAALRMQDFQAEDMKPLQGWITRDPMQWAAEQNVRGVKGAGEPVGAAIAAGNADVMSKLGGYSTNAAEPAVASQSLATALRQYGQTRQGNVTAAYQTARASAGKDLDVPLEGLAQDYANALDTFGDKVPSAVQTKFRALGLDPSQPSNQKKVFTFEDADKLRKVINDNVDMSAPRSPTNLALARIRDALDKAQYSVDATGGPFAPAVATARDWFQQQRAVPALADAIGGPVDDRFVQQAVINNPSTPNVQKLAALLREHAPDQYEAVRQQMGQYLEQAAFGENVAGDAAARQASYNKALRTLGTGKLEAFFEPDEVDQMKRLGRIMAYQVQPPAGAASNYSNTASTVANLLRKLGPYTVVAKGPVQFAGDQLEASAALKPSVPVSPNISDAQRLMLARALMGVTGGGVGAALGSVGQQP